MLLGQSSNEGCSFDLSGSSRYQETSYHRVWLQNISATRKCHPEDLTGILPLYPAPVKKRETQTHLENLEQTDIESWSLNCSWSNINRLPSRGWPFGLVWVSLPSQHSGSWLLLLWRHRTAPEVAWMWTLQRSSAQPGSEPPQHPLHLFTTNLFMQTSCVDHSTTKVAGAGLVSPFPGSALAT